MAALTGGTQRIANLRALIDRATGWQKGRTSGLFGFIAFIDAMKKSRVTIGQVKLLSENEDVVRIMTVHKSKGLEFPMVIVTQLAKRLRRGRTTNRIDFHKDYGIALQWEDYETHTWRKTLLQQLITAKRDREQRAEDVRVLYVALTRAMDKLVMLGTAKDASELLDGANMLDPRTDLDVLRAASYFEMMLPLISGSGLKTELVRAEEFASDIRVSGQLGRNIGMLLDAIESQPPGDYYDEIDARLSGAYPYEGAANVKSKYSVSELNRESQTPARVNAAYYTEGSLEETLEDEGGLTCRGTDEGDSLPRTPADAMDAADAANAALSPAERGSALHRAFEKLNYPVAYERRSDRAYFGQYLDGLRDGGFLSESERAAVHPATLQRYANTELFARAAASDSLRRESPFNLRHERGGEPIIVQGIIDCFFFEQDPDSPETVNLILIDFKSGYYNMDDANEDARIANLYRTQLELYKEALEAAVGIPVAEAYIYLTGVGKAVLV
jgi:ATP-dependent helicase/nuclease subunit A